MKRISRTAIYMGSLLLTGCASLNGTDLEDQVIDAADKAVTETSSPKGEAVSRKEYEELLKKYSGDLRSREEFVDHFEKTYAEQVGLVGQEKTAIIAGNAYVAAARKRLGIAQPKNLEEVLKDKGKKPSTPVKDPKGTSGKTPKAPPSSAYTVKVTEYALKDGLILTHSDFKETFGAELQRETYTLPFGRTTRVMTRFWFDTNGDHRPDGYVDVNSTENAISVGLSEDARYIAKDGSEKGFSAADLEDYLNETVSPVETTRTYTPTN